MKKRLTHPVELPLLAMIVLASASNAIAQAPITIDGKHERCIQGLPMAKAMVISQATAKPGLLSNGAEILPETTASKIESARIGAGETAAHLHASRMRLRPKDVPKGDVGRYIDFQTICRSSVDQAGDYSEKCRLDPTKLPKVGVDAYETLTTLRENKTDSCKTGMSIEFRYVIVPNAEYVNGLSAFSGLASTDQIKGALKVAIDPVFENWINGFKTP